MNIELPAFKLTRRQVLIDRLFHDPDVQAAAMFSPIDDHTSSAAVARWPMSDPFEPTWLKKLQATMSSLCARAACTSARFHASGAAAGKMPRPPHCAPADCRELTSKIASLWKLLSPQLPPDVAEIVTVSGALLTLPS